MSLIDLDEEVFWNTDEFAVECTLTKKDASASVTTIGILEDAILQEEGEGGYAPREARHPQVTCPTNKVEGYTEGDTITIKGISYTILDPLGDHTQTTFTLED